MKNIAIILFAFILFSCKQEYTESKESAVVVKKARVLELKESNEPIPIFGAGRIESSKNKMLSFKTGGIIRSLKVTEGQSVKAGQVIAILDLSEINAQVQKADEEVRKMERDYQRAKVLYEDSAATLQSVQDLETGLNVARANLEIAKFNQGYSKIVAPDNGTVLRKLREENELVAAGEPIIQLSSKSDGMILKVGLSDKDIVNVNLGDAATVTLDAYKSQSIEGYVIEIAGDASITTSTYQVEIALSPNNLKIKDGFFAKAEILPKQVVPYFKIPAIALVDGDDEGIAVLYPDEDIVRKKSFTPVYIGSDFIAVNAQDLGLNQILSEGAAYLTEGDKFQTLD